MKNLAPIEDLRAALEYRDGALYWKVDRSARVKAGSRAGTAGDGRRQVCFRKLVYTESRLVWAIVHGEWPKHDIDHINRDQSDNRVENLRDITRQQNGWNSGIRSTNRSGRKGVHWQSSMRKWAAKITVNYRTIPLGYFDDVETASRAYEAAAREHHGEFACSGDAALQVQRERLGVSSA